MFVLTLLSGGLFVLPIIVTVGVFIGVEHQYLFQGTGEIGSGWFRGGDGGRIKTETYCQKFYGITPFPGRYVFNPNQWGDPTNSGNLCMNVTYDKRAAKEELFAAGFSTTWQYPPGPESEPVHAFPNAALILNDTLPVQMSDVQSLILDVSWTYGIGSYVHNTTNNTVLHMAKLNANVAVDMFAAEKKEHAANTTEADYEVMVWLGRWGDATDPIGYAKGSQATELINGTTFDLFYGDNSLGQRVFTWLADKNTTEFVGDLAPLITTLAAQTGPSETSYVGYVAFGTEALYSFENVTFYTPKLEMDIITR